MKLNNLSDFTRIVIIDDVAKEGEAIRKALLTKGISSAFFCVSSSAEEPNGPYKNIRLVFLDLELLGSSAASGAESRAVVALAKLAKIVDVSSHYVLVVWSSNTTKPIANEFKKQLHRAKNVANPIKEIYVDKSNCKTRDGEFSLSKINAAINTGLSNIPAFTVFSEGERIFQNAVGLLTTSIVKGKDNDNLARTIYSLAHMSEKPKSKSKIPNSALTNINGLLESAIEKEVASHSFGNLHLKLGKQGLSEEDAASLNTTLIFTPDRKKGSGAIYFIRKNKRMIETILDNNPMPKAFKLIKCFYLDVTPLCGSAQENGNNYFIEGVIHPTYRGVKGPQKGSLLKAGNIYGYTFKDNFMHKNNISKISFNLKSYSTNSKLVDSLEVGEKLRHHIVMDIQHKIASYISRPGHALLN